MQFCCWNLAVSKDNYCYDLPYYFVWIKYIYIFVIGNIECVSIWTSMLIKAPLNFMLDVTLWMDLSIDLICFLLWLVLLLYNTSVLHDIKLNINIPNFIYMYCLRQVCVCATLPPWSACTVHLICQHCCIMIHKPYSYLTYLINRQQTGGNPRWKNLDLQPGVESGQHRKSDHLWQLLAPASPSNLRGKPLLILVSVRLIYRC